jgi:hypothetical protein
MDRGLGGTVERIGARFEQADAAWEALQAVRTRFGLGVADVEVHALGSTDYGRPATEVVLAGRFPADIAGEAVEELRARGGAIVERRVELVPGISTSQG